MSKTREFKGRTFGRNAVLIEEARAAMKARGERLLIEANAVRKRNEEFARVVQSPLLHLVRQDLAACRALEKIPKLKGFAGLEDDGKRISRRSSTLSLTLHEKLNFHSRPYDFEWNWGNSQQHIASRATGQIAILGRSGDFANGTTEAVRAACGIGAIVISDRPAIVSVRPLVDCQFQFINQSNGLWIGASSKGGIDTAVFDGPNLVAGVKRTELWSSSVYSGFGDGHEIETGEDAGFAWIPI